MKNANDYSPLAHKSSTFVGDRFSFLYNTLNKEGIVTKCQARLGNVVKFNADTFTLDIGNDQFRQFRWNQVLGSDVAEKTGIMVS